MIIINHCDSFQSLLMNDAPLCSMLVSCANVDSRLFFGELFAALVRELSFVVLDMCAVCELLGAAGRVIGGIGLKATMLSVHYEEYFYYSPLGDCCTSVIVLGTWLVGFLSSGDTTLRYGQT
jgi:hypothetical protein